MSFINDERILKELNSPIDTSPEKVRSILEKARELKGIEYGDVLTLLRLENEDLVQELYDTAKYIKDTIYGKRLVLFAPLYVTNVCKNECTYCAFRVGNKKLKRRTLNQEEVAHEAERLIDQGQKRVLLVAGEDGSKKNLDYVIESIKTIYSIKKDKGDIRRINVNIAPLSIEGFKRLKECNIGTYQSFQETYHRKTYEEVHVKGPKADYEDKLFAMDRAFQAGLDDVGIGVLFGLYDWKYEILAMLEHIKHLEDTFGVGPHTISLPRIEPALNSDISYNPPYAVNDEDFFKIIAVLRIAVPYTGLILSTRETEKTRKFAFDLGVSQVSAGSKTNPGGYEADKEKKPSALDEGAEDQFSLGDTRSLLEVIKDMIDSKYIPSFCTGCYRLGRVGADFMDLAKPGLIKDHCLPNAIFSFAEYVYDFGDEELKSKAFELINEITERDIRTDSLKEKIKIRLIEIEKGKRDIYF